MKPPEKFRSGYPTAHRSMAVFCPVSDLERLRRAVMLLEALRAEGLTHLVFPSASFWWLEHYERLDAYLRHGDRRVWNDERCIIYACAQT